VTKPAYALGEIPELGQVPEKMHAFVIRKERHGEPSKSMLRELMYVPEPGPNEVLVYVMAAGVNYNGVWAALGKPLSVLDVHKKDYHIAGSDASGVVWKVGSGVKSWKPGDEVVIHCNQSCGECEQCNGGDPMLCPNERIWGYETPQGSFAQFTCVQAQQLMPKPKHLSWEEASCYTLVLATAYRMLFGHPPHTVKPGDNVLIWGGAGGLGSMAIQLVANAGANAIAVISSDDKLGFVKRLGAKAAINRKDFNCWGQLPDTKNREVYGEYLKEVRKFGKAIWDITGKGNDVDIVFEHPGEQTFPVSCFVVKRGGMVVFCAGTTGFNLTFDAAYVWMRTKRIQGSHFATLAQAAAANRLVINGKIDPCLSRVFEFDETPLPHELMRENKHPPGNMAILVNARRRGLLNLADTRRQGDAASTKQAAG
jgi:crotonyl-CoA carboxylase/reductase